MTRLRLVLLALTLAVPSVVRAQTASPADLLQAVRQATAQGDYAAAEARAREALLHYADFAPDQLVEIHTTLGIVLHARNEAVEARRQFEAALSLDPTFVLDPVLVSPRTVELFETLRADRARTEPLGAPSPAVRYVVLTDPRPGAALRSALLPGWGQFAKGDRARGIIFAVGVGTSAAASVAAHVAYTQADGRYDAATMPDEIDRTYRTANRLYRTRNVLALVTALGWGAAVFDALIAGGPRVPGDPSSPGASVRITAAEAGAGVALRLGF